MLKRDTTILEGLIKKYGFNTIINEVDGSASSTLKAVAQDQVRANNNEPTKYTTEQRRKALVSFFKSKNYHDYIATLNQMAKDDKFRVLVDAAFGGDDNEALGNVHLNVNKDVVKVLKLYPTQSEIDITKSLIWGLRGGEKETNVQVALANIDKFFSGQPIKLGKGEGLPIVTFDKFIIDGHHRWSQVYCFNPKATMACIDYDGDLTALEMLKATQGCIAAIRKNVPSAIVEGSNMFSASEKEVANYIAKNILDEVVERIKKYVPELKDKNDVVKYITNNCMRMKTNNIPMFGQGGTSSAPNRGDMPQTDTVSQNDLAARLKNGVIEIPGNK